MTTPAGVDQERRDAQAVKSRSVLPIAIVASYEDVVRHRYAPWELVYDQMGGIHSRRHGYGQTPKFVVRRIRCDEPANMVAGETVPIPLRTDFDEARRERRKLVEGVADAIIRGNGGEGVNLTVDFDLEREVLDELWKRWREVTADDFLVRSLRAAAQ